jgi:hypothetical protein
MVAAVREMRWVDPELSAVFGERPPMRFPEGAARVPAGPSTLESQLRDVSEPRWLFSGRAEPGELSQLVRNNDSRICETKR